MKFAKWQSWVVKPPVPPVKTPSLEDHNSCSDVLVPSAKLNGALWQNGGDTGCVHGGGICEIFSWPCSFALCQPRAVCCPCPQLMIPFAVPLRLSAYSELTLELTRSSGQGWWCGDEMQ